MNRSRVHFIGILLISTLFAACASKPVEVVPINKSKEFAYRNRVAKLNETAAKSESKKAPDTTAQNTQPVPIDKVQEDVTKLEMAKDYNGLKEYTDKNPNAVYYIKDEPLRLALTGPKGLKVGDIREYLQGGKSELIILSMIKQQEVPYKKFTLHEIDLLIQMGLTDKVIASMIDVTTALLHDEKLKKQQEYYLEEQKKLTTTQQPQVVYQTVQTPQQQSDDTTDKVKNEVIKQGVGILLDQLFHR
jgi:hypothetical protein